MSILAQFRSQLSSLYSSNIHRNHVSLAVQFLALRAVHSFELNLYTLLPVAFFTNFVPDTH
jgi:hypothetical protein